jgi:hypothetical protein
LIQAARVQAQGSRAGRDESSGGAGIAAGEEGDLVAESDEFLGEEGGDAFGTAVQFWRDALKKG